MTDLAQRDHGGGLDAAVARFGGARADWLDLSTGINPVPYPVPALPPETWTDLPDTAAMDRLLRAARRFWRVPDGAGIVAAPGASALIARLPRLMPPGGKVWIPAPTYNEWAAAFAGAGWSVGTVSAEASVQVFVHPNNPDGAFCPAPDPEAPSQVLTLIDESFCDVVPEASHIAFAARGDVAVIKSFGKFWGLAGLRLGFLIGPPELVAAVAEALGPWPVSGPALKIGAHALEDRGWAAATRARLARDCRRLDRLLTARGGAAAGGTALFRLYAVDNAAGWQARLAQGRVWSRIFPYSKTWLRLGLPAPDRWAQLEAAV